MTDKVEIILVGFDPKWAEKFKNEKEAIMERIGDYVLSIDHIGSTAIPNIVAKPVIDILIGIKSLNQSEKIIATMKELEYEYIEQIESHFPERRLFVKPPKDSGKRQFNVHIWEHKSEGWEEMLLFRDYLLVHPETAKEYEFVKKYMAKRFPNNEIAYSIGKEGFMQVILLRAKSK
ncbi:MAG: GrpB family protein [Candidatus Heimdallarchaeota archaeon]